MRSSVPRLVVAVLLAGAARTAAAAPEDVQPAVIPGEVTATAQRLADARKHLDAGRWTEALDVIRGVLGTAGDDLVPIDADRSVRARSVCAALLAGLPGDALDDYRRRAEPAARKWLDEGAAARDARLLRRAADEAPATPAAAAATELLGDLAFERGHFGEAAAWWQALLPDDANGPRSPAAAVPAADRPRLLAKLLLARVYHRPDRPWAAELKDFRQRHGDAEGELGGRKGRLPDLLEGLAAGVQADPATDWHTFGGDAGRGLVLPAPPRLLDRLAALARDGPEWRFHLGDRRPLDEAPTPPARAASVRERAASLAFHPLIVNGQVVVADGRYVTAYDVRTGAAQVWYDAASDRATAFPGPLPSPPDVRHTLTAAEGCLFARLGAPEVRPAREDADRPVSLLACLSLEPAPGEARRRWVTEPAGGGLFEGAPVVRDGLALIAASRPAGERTVTSVQCWVVHADRPLLRWQQDVCEAREPRGPRPRVRHHLLTLAGPNAVYCSHAGAVVALDALTGRRAWAVRYPSRGLTGRGPDAWPHDLAPCLSADGRLYVAPGDSDRLLCLDPRTGRVLWQRERLRVAHLLGVGEGRLIFATATGLRAVGAADGSDADGWVLPDDGSELPPLGRGLLIGDLVLWPTPRGVFTVRQRDGRQADNPAALAAVPPGNLAYGEGCLAVADREVLSVFVPPALRLDAKEREAQAAPASAPVLLRLARAQADAGRAEQAVKTYERIEALARQQRRSALASRAQTGRRLALLEQARAAIQRRDWDAAEAAARRAAHEEFPEPDRVESFSRVAEWLGSAGQPGRAAAAWYAVLAEPRLRAAPLRCPDGSPASGAALAMAGLDRLRATSDATAFQPFEDAAVALIDAAPAAQRAAVLERVATELPDTAASRAALRELAALHEKAGRPGAAAAAWRRLLARPNGDDDRLAALLGLAHAYERQGCRAAARAAWQRLAREHGSEPLPGVTPAQTVREFAEARLRKTVESAAEPLLPLRRRWSAVLTERESVIPVEVADGDSTGCVLSRAGNRVVCRDAATGRTCWERVFPITAEWGAAHADTFVLGGPAGLVGVRREDGAALWEVTVRGADSLGAFRLANGRAFALQDGRRLVALDAESGRLLWSADAPGAPWGSPRGRFHPNYLAVGDRVLVQSAAGRALLLDAACGQLVRDLPVHDAPWADPPLGVGGGRALVAAAPDRAVLVDLRGGDVVWSFVASGVTTLTGAPPRFTAGGDALLVTTSTNLGHEVRRLDPASGRSLWSEPVLLPEHEIDPAAWAVDGDLFAHASGGRLVARSLEDGRVRWAAPLPADVPRGAAWAVSAAPDCLLAWPAPGRRARFRFRWLGFAVQWNVFRPAAGGPEVALSVLGYTRDTGRLVQRLNLPLGAARLEALAAIDVGLQTVPRAERLATTGERPAWARRTVGRGLVVAGGATCWGLSPDGSANDP